VVPASYQYDNRKVPVLRRRARHDAGAENDSHGEFIYVVAGTIGIQGTGGLEM